MFYYNKTRENKSGRKMPKAGIKDYIERKNQP